MPITQSTTNIKGFFTREICEPRLESVPARPLQITTTTGGRHSFIGRAFHLLPADALMQVAEVLHDGAKAKNEPEDLADSRKANWRKIAKHEHINHALNHVFEYLDGAQGENHLAHAACRLLFALEMGNDQS